MTDIYIPIGMNCYIANFLKSKKLRLFALPFDWNISSLHMSYNVLYNDFDGFLDNLFIGTQTHRLLFDEDDNTKLTVSNSLIFPVICKKYNILFPHDFPNINDKTILDVKDKYNRRIQRFRHIINDPSKNIYLIYCDLNNDLNEFQTSVYQEYNPKLLNLFKNNDIYIDKIKTLYEKHNNIKIISLEELKTIIS